MENSDDYRPVVTLLEHYQKQPGDREMIDRVLIWLCGWSLQTLVTGQHDDQKIDFTE